MRETKAEKAKIKELSKAFGLFLVLMMKIQIAALQSIILYEAK